MSRKQSKRGNAPNGGATGGARRAVLYARTSKDDAANATSSIQGQLDLCREYAQKKGWTVVRELVDDGVSGATWNAPALSEAVEMARAGVFDILVTRELDRLARDLVKQLVIEGELAATGVELAYVLGDYADTPEGALTKHIRAVISEYERLKITERMVRGRRQRAQAGHVVMHGAPPYGYCLAKDGEKTTLAIDEDEAAVVRLIFEWYTGSENLGALAIAARLTELGVPTPTDTDKGRSRGGRKRPYATWGASTVANILNNQTYAGVWHYSKLANQPEQLIAVAVPAVIDNATFQAAQQQKQRNTIQAKRNVKHGYLLRSRIVCAGCGANMIGCYTTKKTRLFYYRCVVGKALHHYAHTCSQSKHFRADRVDAAVWEWVRSYLADPALLAEGLAAYQAERDQATAPLRERIAVVDKLVADHQAQLTKLLDLYLSSDFPKEMLTDREQRLTDTIAALKRERADLAAQLSVDALTDDDVQGMFAFAAEVAEGLEAADADFDLRRRIIELLDVRVTCAVEDGERVIYPTCRFWSGERLSVASNGIDTTRCLPC
jgi:site-specific DNA recombinase